MTDAPDPDRPVQLRVGGATDVGRLRQVNQDSMLLGPVVHAVADGMGGHAAGEVASKLTIDTITAALADHTGDLRVSDIVEAIQTANDVVFEQSNAEPDLAGMGTTVVAVALVREDGEARLAILNVGDSRAYRLSAGDLTQISDDHSLVGDLVRDGSITRDEARTHPRKNIVTRAIGIDRYVDVDDFQILPRRGDRYLLCSDGLTDELTEDEVEAVLTSIGDPDEAAAELVARANANGGRDNITVVIVDVVDDGLTDDARAALPDDVAFSHHPDADTQGVLAVPDDQAHRQNARDQAGFDPMHDTGEFAPLVIPDLPRTPRVVTVRSLAFVVTVLLLVGGGAFLAYNYARNTFHVGVDDTGQVTIYRGRVGGFWWFDPTVVERTDIDVDTLPENARDDVEAGVSQPTRSAAERYVENLRDLPPITTTTPTTPTTSTTSTTSTTVRPTTTTVRPTTTAQGP